MPRASRPRAQANGTRPRGNRRSAHERYMARALALARSARGRTWPNPMVGAVIVNAGRVVGEGYHTRAGGPHAEVEALRAAGPRARGATLYVTLEPCNHVGLTPPCCEAVRAAGIAQVVMAMKDPHPRTNGRGMQCLRRAGIRVISGILEKDARALTADFARRVRANRPWVIAKIAQSLDGKIATRTGESRWISSAASRQVVHRLRHQVDALVVGINTVRQDNPALSARGPHGSRAPRGNTQPLRVIVDSHLTISPSSRCVSGASAQVVVATTARQPRRCAALQRRGVDVMVFPPVKGRVPLERLFRALKQRYQVETLLLEGGGELIGSALESRLVDRLLWMVAPMIIGGRLATPAVGGTGARHLRDAVQLEGMRWRRAGQDLIIEAAPVYPTPARSRARAAAHRHRNGTRMTKGGR